VAIKQLSSIDPDKLERFRREARALAQLRHPHIVTVLDVGEDGGAPFIVLEYVAGETLKERIRRGPLPIDEAIAYAIEVARALAAAHRAGIVHRDVKSQNILLSAEGGAKLSDFGIARYEQQVALTLGGRVLGTTDYVAPEQALGHEVAGPADVYSLGIVLFESLTGRVPFVGGTQLEVATRHVREQLPDVQRLRPEVSATLAAVVDRATAKRVERRYGDADAMVADLERALAVETSRTGEASGEAEAVLKTLPRSTYGRLPLRMRARGTLATAAAVAALVGVAVALFALEGLHDRHRAPARAPRPRPPRVSVVYAPIALAGAKAVSYNPFGTDGPDDPLGAALAIDGKPGDAWRTSQYDNGSLGTKSGVGLYVKLAAPVAAARLALATPTPGIDLQVYGARTVAPAVPAGALVPAALGWHLLGEASDIGRQVQIRLDEPKAAFAYYLVWITHLEPDPTGAAISAGIGDLSLLRATPHAA
jgi:hypothetical protein